jgi:hypothetical protein
LDDGVARGRLIKPTKAARMAEAHNSKNNLHQKANTDAINCVKQPREMRGQELR